MVGETTPGVCKQNNSQAVPLISQLIVMLQEVSIAIILYSMALTLRSLLALWRLCRITVGTPGPVGGANKTHVIQVIHRYSSLPVKESSPKRNCTRVNIPKTKSQNEHSVAL